MKMKEIKQGTLYGFDLVLKVPKDFPNNDLLINTETLRKYIEIEKNRRPYIMDNPFSEYLSKIKNA